jgi:hypothetical protein
VSERLGGMDEQRRETRVEMKLRQIEAFGRQDTRSEGRLRKKMTLRLFLRCAYFFHVKAFFPFKNLESADFIASSVRIG